MKVILEGSDDVTGNEAIAKCINSNKNILLKTLPNLHKNDIKEMEVKRLGQP